MTVSPVGAAGLVRRANGCRCVCLGQRPGSSL